MKDSILKELIKQWREGLVSAKEVLEYIEKLLKGNTNYEE